MLFSSHNSALCCLETDVKKESTALSLVQAIYERDTVVRQKA